jgi:hypothetical protein
MALARLEVREIRIDLRLVFRQRRRRRCPVRVHSLVEVWLARERPEFAAAPDTL